MAIIGDRIDDPQFRIVIDGTRGIVRTEARGVQSAADVDRYVAALRGMLDRARQRFGRALVLADLREAPIRSQEAAERLRTHNSTLYRAGERVALLVASSLLKMQLRRTLVADFQNIFMSEAAAETWLLAAQYDAPISPPSRP